MISLTKNQKKEIIRVVGAEFEKSDIPAFMRETLAEKAARIKREVAYEEREMRQIEAEERMTEEVGETNQRSLKG